MTIAAIPRGLEWVNTAIAPSLGLHRGKVVLMVFFTGSSIHSRHLLGQLKAVQNRFDDGVVLIGFHCPKFEAEKSGPAVLKSLNRNFVRFPVANDKQFVAWRAFDIKAWPSIVVVDAAGNQVETLVGEDCVTKLESIVDQLLEDAMTQDLRSFSEVRTASRPEPRLPLSFPGGLAFNDRHLYVSDSGHNRILEVNKEGRVTRIFGSGNPGLWDGILGDAGFSNPQGLAILGQDLFVADMGNHCVRRIRLFTGEISTLAGNGELGYPQIGDVPDPLAVALNSPAGLVIHRDQLYMSLAGANQIWRYDLGKNRLMRFSGSGGYGLKDGDCDHAEFAQPVGLAAHRDRLLVADADNSAIRMVRVADGRVKTMVGRGTFQWGDADGIPDVAALQFVQTVATDGERASVWIGDSFNDKLKVLDLHEQAVKTLQLRYRFKFPSAMVVDGDQMWVACCHSHEVVSVNLATGRCVSMVFDGLNNQAVI
ncbi:MAG: hypothetical protein DHS20C11_19160 [Lysobacteraceae bacterium]|nr:MAG: hypothetical protein DHS20C11_19160 [Xanthomonadaceae bacterium]